MPRALTVLSCTVLLTAACAHQPWLLENVHDVVPGVLVRSGQLSGDRLSQVIEEKKIKSVLNLRGMRPDADWYRDELKATSNGGAEHFDFPLSASNEVPPWQARRLIELMQKAPKPLLVHCHGGADRTGLASALYLYEIEHQLPMVASAALSIRYRHLAFTATHAMDRSFKAFVEAEAAPK